MENQVAIQKVATENDLVWDPSDVDLGFDGILPGCVKQGFLKVAQFSSDEIKKGNAKYIPGLEVGHYFCPQRRKVYGANFLAVALKFWQSYAVYDGEGPESKFKGNMTVAEFDKKVKPYASRERSYMMDKEGYRYVDCRNFLLIPYDNPLETPMIMSMTSTAISASRDWLTLMESLTVKVKRGDEIVEVPVPMRGGVWKLTSTYVTNKKGDYYQVAAPEFVHLIDPSLPVGGITLRDRVNSLHLEAKNIDVMMVSADLSDFSDSDDTHEPSKSESNVSNLFSGKSDAQNVKGLAKEAEIF